MILCHGAAQEQEALTLTDHLVNHALEITCFSVFLDFSIGDKTQLYCEAARQLKNAINPDASLIFTWTCLARFFCC